MRRPFYRPKCLAKPAHFFVGAVTVSMYKDVVREGIRDCYLGITLAGYERSEVDRIKAMLDELRKSRYAETFVRRWIKGIVITNSTFKWKHFCNGYVFIWSRDNTPNNVLATYIFRWAVEICLYNRFKHVEVLLEDARCGLLADRSQIRLMKTLGCDADYVQYLERRISSAQH